MSLSTPIPCHHSCSWPDGTFQTFSPAERLYPPDCKPKKHSILVTVYRTCFLRLFKNWQLFVFTFSQLCRGSKFSSSFSVHKFVGFYFVSTVRKFICNLKFILVCCRGGVHPSSRFFGIMYRKYK